MKIAISLFSSPTMAFPGKFKCSLISKIHIEPVMIDGCLTTKIKFKCVLVHRDLDILFCRSLEVWRSRTPRLGGIVQRQCSVKLKKCVLYQLHGPRLPCNSRWAPQSISPIPQHHSQIIYRNKTDNYDNAWIHAMLSFDLFAFSQILLHQWNASFGEISCRHLTTSPKQKNSTKY